MRAVFTAGVSLLLMVSAPNYAREPYVAKPYLGIHLAGHVPDGWQTASSTASEFMEIVTYLPREQTPENWEEMVMVYTPTIAPNRPKLENEKPEDILRITAIDTREAKAHCDAIVSARLCRSYKTITSRQVRSNIAARMIVPER